MLIKVTRRFYSELKSPCLVRDFIYDRLYHPNQGYFCNKNIQIGELRNHIDFKSMIGYDDYKRFVSENYPENAWLTPSELFKPWYGFTIANYMHNVLKKLKIDPKNNKIRVIEVGAGAGSALDSILVFFNNYEQSLYHLLEYVIVEISPQMCQRAKENLSKTHKKLLDRGHIKIINDDFLHYKQQNSSSKEFNFIIFLEVLDNMPHDKVVFCPNSQDWKFQTMIEIQQNKPKEFLTQISDPLITEALQLYSKFLSKESQLQFEKKRFFEKILEKMWRREVNSLFLPTISLKMLKHVRENFANHHLIIADFDLLPSETKSKKGINAPIVSKKLRKSHEKQDFDSYLVEKGEADIFFPTNFSFLQYMYKEICGKKSFSLKSYEFMNEFSKEKWAETKSGYNPLKEDFQNTSFLVSEV